MEKILRLLKLTSLSLTVFYLVGCASTPTNDPALGYETFKNQEYPIPLQGQQTNGPTLMVRVGGVTLNEEETLIQPKSQLATEINKSITNSGVAIQDGLKNVAIKLPPDCRVQMIVSFNNTEDTHSGSRAAKGFLTGFFTLGLVGYIAPGEYSYQSKVIAEVTGCDGKTRTFTAESQEVTAKYDLNDANAGRQAGSTVRQQANTESLNKIATQLVQSDIFQEKP